MNKKVFSLAIMLCFVIALSACSDTGETDALKMEISEAQEALESVQVENEALTKDIETLESQILESQTNVNQQGSLLSEAFTVIDLLGNMDMVGLSSHVHPTEGVRFSPYSYVDLQNDQVFTSGQIASAWADTNAYLWGAYDGSGEPILQTFSDYYGAFVYDVDFANPHIIGNNVIVGTGNMINNVPASYPGGEFVEFHFTGFDPQYEGMDWESLRLVFEDYGGDWYLVGIIHDQWTI